MTRLIRRSTSSVVRISCWWWRNERISLSSFNTKWANCITAIFLLRNTVCLAQLKEHGLQWWMTDIRESHPLVSPTSVILEVLLQRTKTFLPNQQKQWLASHCVILLMTVYYYPSNIREVFPLISSITEWYIHNREKKVQNQTKEWSIRAVKRFASTSCLSFSLSSSHVVLIGILSYEHCVLSQCCRSTFYYSTGIPKGDSYPFTSSTSASHRVSSLWSPESETIILVWWSSSSRTVLPLIVISYARIILKRPNVHVPSLRIGCRSLHAMIVIRDVSLLARSLSFRLRVSGWRPNKLCPQSLVWVTTEILRTWASSKPQSKCGRKSWQKCLSYTSRGAFILIERQGSYSLLWNDRFSFVFEPGRQLVRLEVDEWEFVTFPPN